MQTKVLAVASKGGHWEQLMLLTPAFEDVRVVFASTDARLSANFEPGVFVPVADYSRSNPLKVLAGVFEMYRLLRSVKPDLVISTGAAPGLVAVALGCLLGARTIWIDSIANSEKLSLSGSVARKFTDLTLTQWEHLSERGGCKYWGGVI